MTITKYTAYAFHKTQVGNMKDDFAEMAEQDDFRYKPIGHVKSVFQGTTSLLLSTKKINFIGVL